MAVGWVTAARTGLRQEWLLYRFWDAAGRLLYIGQTGRIAVTRLLEHVRKQSWAPQIARVEVDPTVYTSLADVLDAERAAILREQPIYNGTHNHANPHRVITARPAGRPARWSPTPVRRRAWTRRRIRLVAVGSVWLIVTVAMTWAVLPQVPVGTALWLGPTASTGLVVAGAWQSRRRRW